jgi:membrane-associated phospholipid phosphatase
MIPFYEYFIIPYLLWFLYLAVGILFFMFKSKKDYLRLVLFTFVGLFICVLICLIFPTAISFRPTSFDRDNIFIKLVLFIYGTDTPTNVCPSMHCYAAIGINIAVFKSDYFKRKYLLKTLSAVLMLSICLSTVFIKQHSILDFFAAIGLSAIMYPLAYTIKWKFIYGKPPASIEPSA